MDVNNKSAISSLLAPPSPTDVLIPGESILYNERKHWATLIQAFIETLAALVVITAVSSGTGGASNSVGRFSVFVIICAVGLFIYRVKKGDWSEAAAYASGAGLIIGFVIFGQVRMAIIGVLFIVGRFFFRFMIWAFYERLYITNRRIIMSSGFLGSEISTMPLTRVTDISYRTTIMADILGYGILRVESAGQDQALSLISYLAYPSRFYNILIDRSTAAVGSVTEKDEKDEPPDYGNLDEDDGSGTLAPEARPE